jgi:hypothetical protein
MTEESALACVLVGGGLDVRFLSRKLRTQLLTESNEDSAVATSTAAPLEDPPPLPVPKKTKLYVEFARRERDKAPELHNAFQQCASNTYLWSHACSPLFPLLQLQFSSST